MFLIFAVHFFFFKERERTWELSAWGAGEDLGGAGGGERHYQNIVYENIFSINK